MNLVHPSPAALTLDSAAPWLDRELYPFAPKRFGTPDGALSYLDEGTGSPVLLVHGPSTLTTTESASP